MIERLCRCCGHWCLPAELNGYVGVIDGSRLPEDPDEGIDTRFDVHADRLHQLEVIAVGEWDDEIDLRSEPDLREAAVLSHSHVLLQIEWRDAVDVVIGDLQDVVVLLKIRRIHAVEHALITVEVVGSAVVDDEVVHEAVLDLEHRPVQGAQRLQRLVGEEALVWQPVDVHVIHRHEDPDDQALLVERVILHGLAERIRFALDLHQGVGRVHVLLIENHAIGRREEIFVVRERRAAWVAEEVFFGYPFERLCPLAFDVRFDPFPQRLRHTWALLRARIRSTGRAPWPTRAVIVMHPLLHGMNRAIVRERRSDRRGHTEERTWGGAAAASVTPSPPRDGNWQHNDYGSLVLCERPHTRYVRWASLTSRSGGSRVRDTKRAPALGGPLFAMVP